MPSRYLTSDNYVVDTLTVNGVTVTSGAISAYDPTTVSGAVASGNAALISANTAQASGNASLVVTTTALASGNAAIPLSLDALASGNLALDYLVGASGVPGAWARVTAGVTVSSGDAVGLNSQGTIEPTRTIAISPSVTSQVGSASRITTNSINPDSSTAYSTHQDLFLSVYPDSSVYDYGTCTTFRLTSSGTFDKGSPVIFESVPCRGLSCAYSTVDDVFGVFYGVKPSGVLKSLAVKTSGLFAQAGPSSRVGEGDRDCLSLTSNTALAYSKPTNCFISAYPAIVNPWIRVDSLAYTQSTVAGVVGTFATNVSRNNYENGSFLGSAAASGASGYVSACTSPNYPIGSIAYGTREGLYVYNFGLDGGVLGKYITSATDRIQPVTNSCSKVSSVYDSINDRVVIGYVDLSASNACKVVAVNVVDGTANAVSVGGSPATVNSNSTGDVQLVYDYPNARFHIAYSDDSSGTNLNVAVGSVSDLSITLGGSTPITTNTTSSYSAAYSTVQTKPVFTFANSDNGNALTALACSAGSGTQYYPQIKGSPSFIGVAQANASGGESVTVALSRSIDKNQSGLTAPQYQYIDYTVSGSFTSATTKPTYWPEGKHWTPVAQSINSSTVVLLDSY